MKKQIKSLVMDTYSRYVQFRRNQNNIKKIEEQIAESHINVPELTSEQEKQIKEYWGKYGIDITTHWHKLYYAATGINDPRFVPNPIFQKVIKAKMNNHTFASVWSDKAYIDRYLNGVKTVRSIVRNVEGRFLNEQFDIITFEEASRIIESYSELVIKPATDTESGKGVDLLKAPYDLKKLHDLYCKNYVIQIPIRQHSGMAKLNESSVNTIRVNTVLFDKDAYVMSAFVKVGMPGAFADNQGHDRYFIGIKENGTYWDYAINHDLQKFESIPSGFPFAGQPVQSFEEVCKTAVKAHKCIPHFGFAFWDICVDEDGTPVIVEVNLKYPSTVIPQVAGGPFLGKYTDLIMEYIKNK